MSKRKADTQDPIEEEEVTDIFSCSLTGDISNTETNVDRNITSLKKLKYDDLDGKRFVSTTLDNRGRIISTVEYCGNKKDGISNEYRYDGDYSITLPISQTITTWKMDEKDGQANEYYKGMLTFCKDWSNGHLRYYDTYYENGILNSHVEYHTSNFVSLSEIYNTDGFCTRSAIYWKNGNPKKVVDYNQDGNTIVRRYCRKNGYLRQTLKTAPNDDFIEENYNNIGNIISERVETSSGNTVDRVYSDSGHLQSEIHRQNNIITICNKFYDNSDMILEESYYWNPDIGDTTMTYYPDGSWKTCHQTDTEGNFVSNRTNYSNGELKTHDYRDEDKNYHSVEYYENGQTKFDRVYNSISQLESEINYTETGTQILSDSEAPYSDSDSDTSYVNQESSSSDSDTTNMSSSPVSDVSIQESPKVPSSDSDSDYFRIC